MPLNLSNINDACDKDNGLPSVCNVNPVNETKGYAHRIHIWEVPAEDWVVIALYFAVIISIGLISAFRHRGSLSGFFLTARSANWLLIGMSMFTANIGSSHFVGLAGSAADYGVSIAVFEMSAVFFLPLLGWLFAPVYMASNVATMPEYLRARFGGRRIQIYIACNALILYIFTKISSDLYAGTLYLNQTLDLDRYLAILLLLAFAAFFTIIGGMTAVLWTSAVQLPVLLIGSFYLLIKVLDRTGGLESLFRQYIESKPNFKLSENTGHTGNVSAAIEWCGTPREPMKSFYLMQPANDDCAPWPGVIFGLTVLNLWYWCNDQVITQHVLASKNLSHVKFGSILTAMLKLLTPFIFVLPGMASRVIYPDFIGCSDPVLCCCYCKAKTGCTNYGYTLLASDVIPGEDSLLPNGARGLMAIAVIAALMSSFTSIFNACSTIFTMDIWRLVRPNATPKELQIIGRVFIVIVCTVSMLWMVIISNESYLFNYIQSITAYFSPPISAVFLLAVFWKRCNEQGAFYGLIVGLLIGIVRCGLEFSYEKPSCAEQFMITHDLRPPALRNVHYLHFAIILFAITTLVTVCLSLVSKPPDQSRINGLTYWTRYEHRISRRPKAKRRSTNSTQNKDDEENHYTTPGEKPDDANNENANNNDNQEHQQLHDLGSRNQQQRVSRLRHFCNWLCGIEIVTDMDALRRSTGASLGYENRQRFSGGGTGGASRPTSVLLANSGGTSGGSHAITQSVLYEQPWMRILSSVLLVIVITISLFFFVLLW